MKPELESKLKRLLELVKQKETAEREIEKLLGWKGYRETKDEMATRLSSVPITEYECTRCNEQFRSNLPVGDAKCPRCGSINVSTWTEPPLVVTKEMEETIDELLEDKDVLTSMSLQPKRKFKKKSCCGSVGPRHKKDCKG